MNLTLIGNLYNIIWGVDEKIEIERQKLIWDELLDLIVEIDNCLNWLEKEPENKKINILLENISAKDNIIGFEGNISNQFVKKYISK